MEGLTLIQSFRLEKNRALREWEYTVETADLTMDRKQRESATELELE